MSRPDEPPEGPVPPVPAPVPVPPAPDARPGARARAAGHLAEVVDPDGVQSGHSGRKIAARWVYGVVAALLALLVSGVVNIWFTGPTVRAEKDAEKKVEDTEEKGTDPFVVRIREEDPGDWPTYVLSRPLTESEKRKLRSFGPGAPGSFVESRAAKRYLETLGARPYSRDMTYSLTFFSARKSPLSITNLRARKLRCTEPDTVTVIQFISQGNSSVATVYFDLREPDFPALTADTDGGHHDEPYFNHNRIDLGADVTPGALRVSGWSDEKTCEWDIQAEYRNADGVFETTIENTGGKPFVALGISRKYREYWTRIPYDGGYWEVCGPVADCTDEQER